MAEVSLVRIDSRLIHGQVVTMWVKVTEAKKIIIIDDNIAKDPLMTQIYTMAAPPGVKVETITVDQAVSLWKDDKFGKTGPILVLFSGVPTAYKSYIKGFDYSKLQVGGIAGGPGRIAVEGTIALNESDAKMLNEMEKKGMEIIFQITTDTKIKTWKSIKDKYFKSI
ncbi:PTS system mannose/fructose/N-acetylgalactosamine-transporter subunit IIB [Acidilutibacter cellobiosedens]|nr:PTS sugar transporter subunit IIB [Acidilutibacter cellobiosedens]